jgi:hypothetical protein
MINRIQKIVQYRAEILTPDLVTIPKDKYIFLMRVYSLL